MSEYTSNLNNQEIDKISSEEIITASVWKYRKQYILVLSLIILFETFLIIRGLMFFDFAKIRRVLYMVSYCSLLTFSVIGLICMISSYKKILSLRPTSN